MGSQAESTRLQLLAEAAQVQSTLHTQRIDLESQLGVYTVQDSLVEIKADSEGELRVQCILDSEFNKTKLSLKYPQTATNTK